jgi:hypothetical protein
MKLTANWRNEIRERWGIRVLSRYNLPVGEVLWVTRCSKTKNGIHYGTPKDLYVSPINRYFYAYVEQRGLPYGVLSDKYGLHMDDEEMEYYDVHPKHLTEYDKRVLGELIREKACRRGFSELVFYNPSPLMSVPYFEMLYYSGLGIFYTTVLNLELERRLPSTYCAPVTQCAPNDSTLR